MPDFWQGVGNWLGDMTGVNQSNQAADQRTAAQGNQAAGAAGMQTGLGTAARATGQINAAGNTLNSATGQIGQAGGTLGTSARQAGALGGKSATQAAAESGQAGAALGQQMGQQQAQAATQNAAQAARTAGVNKGQAAMLGGQAAGQAYTQGQQTGQQLGMGAYGQGASNQLGAINAGTNAGQAQSANAGQTIAQGNAQNNLANTTLNQAQVQGNIGAQQGALGTSQLTNANDASQAGAQNAGALMSGIGSLFQPKLSKGGIVDKPTSAIVGEAGPEAILPLSNPDRVKQILAKLMGTPAVEPIKEAVAEPTGMPEMAAKPSPAADPTLDIIVKLASRVKELESMLQGAT
jgi:hypothetical protein